MSTPTSSVADIRKTFLDFFASKAHTVVQSSPLVPGLLDTASGSLPIDFSFAAATFRSSHVSGTSA